MAGVSGVLDKQGPQALQQQNHAQVQKSQQQIQQAAKSVETKNHTSEAPPKPANPFVGTKINTTA
jgi:hypothetical protein